MTDATPREILLDVFRRAVAAAHPAAFLARHLPPPPKGRLIVIAAGKAGGSMAEVAASYYRAAGVPSERISGVSVARHGYNRPSDLFETIDAGHPVPDEGSLAGAARALALAQAAGPDDLVLVLLSGGASANLVAPAEGLTLEAKRAVTRQLLRSGAAIDEINTVRKRLSRIKGGRLAAAAAPAQVLTLAVSDVPGDDPAIIGSGPTVPDPSTNAEARRIAARHGIAEEILEGWFGAAADETPKPGDPVFGRSAYHVVMTPARMIDAAAAAVAGHGYAPLVLGSAVEGEARDVARSQAQRALALRDGDGKVALLSGGELTVTLKGEGRGGPNQEFALALALALDGAPGISALAADTDGTDGGAGLATDPAGAVIDPTTLTRAREHGLDAARCLEDNDSTGFFEALGDLVEPGPTFTNVNDLRIVLVDPGKND